jgi:hypothetical protein
MALRLMPRSPRRRIRLVTVAGGLKARAARSGFTNLRRLDTSNGCQDHTVLPYASAPFISRAVFAHGKPALQTRHALDAAASTATRPNVRDDGQRPSARDGMAAVLELIWGSREAEYFLLRNGKRLPRRANQLVVITEVRRAANSRSSTNISMWMLGSSMLTLGCPRKRQASPNMSTLSGDDTHRDGGVCEIEHGERPGFVRDVNEVDD